MTDAIEIIHRDHVNLDRFLNVLETVVDGLVPDQPKPNLELLYSAVYYTRVFPDRCHHPKEERYLFGAVRVLCLEERELSSGPPQPPRARGLGLDQPCVRHGQRSAVRRNHGNRVSVAFRENHALI